MRSPSGNKIVGRRSEVEKQAGLSSERRKFDIMDYEELLKNDLFLLGYI